MEMMTSDTVATVNLYPITVPYGHVVEPGRPAKLCGRTSGQRGTCNVNNGAHVYGEQKTCVNVAVEATPPKLSGSITFRLPTYVTLMKIDQVEAMASGALEGTDRMEKLIGFFIGLAGPEGWDLTAPGGAPVPLTVETFAAMGDGAQVNGLRFKACPQAFMAAVREMMAYLPEMLRNTKGRSEELGKSGNRNLSVSGHGRQTHHKGGRKHQAASTA